LELGKLLAGAKGLVLGDEAGVRLDGAVRDGQVLGGAVLAAVVGNIAAEPDKGVGVLCGAREAVEMADGVAGGV